MASSIYMYAYHRFTNLVRSWFIVVIKESFFTHTKRGSMVLSTLPLGLAQIF